MLDGILGLLEPALGVVSASLLGLIALGFGAMFVFFSGAAALVLGQFLRYARAPRIGLSAIVLAVCALGIVGIAVDVEPVWALPVSQSVWGVLGFGLVRWQRAHRPARIGVGVVLLAAGLLFAASLAFPALESAAQWALLVVRLLAAALLIGLWPLVIAGLLQHARERPVEWFLSLRYLFAKRRQTFISIITVICVLGVALGVSVITVVLSVMNGFAHVWEEKIVGTRAHFVVESQFGPIVDYAHVREIVRESDQVLGATPYLLSEAIARGRGGQIQAVLLKGIDPETVRSTTRLAEDLIAGSLDEMDPVPGPDPDPEAGRAGIVIGSELADRFLLQGGDPLLLISPLGGPATPLGPAPRMEKFRVAGIFRSNFFQFDESFVYTTIPSAQKFMRLGDVATGVEVRTVDPYRSRLIAAQVLMGLDGSFMARDWKEFYPGLFRALKMERVMMFVLLSFIMVVAGFIIVATLIMMIMEKGRDIAILKAMGCEDRAILRVFAIEGCLIGIAGLGLGLAMGLVITANLDLIQRLVESSVGFDVLPADVYQLGELPYHVDPLQLVLISLIAMVLSIGATLLPSWQASRLDPAEGLRYE
ncbi:MAG: FtsX-like permease family protein [Myxococcota bacterium]|nr:FtsX-like permease family protein [Myxococcota bacterium]